MLKYKVGKKQNKKHNRYCAKETAADRYLLFSSILTLTVESDIWNTPTPTELNVDRMPIQIGRTRRGRCSTLLNHHVSRQHNTLRP